MSLAPLALYVTYRLSFLSSIEGVASGANGADGLAPPHADTLEEDGVQK